MEEKENIESKDGTLVMPGDEIAYAVEFAPGKNTYEEGGKVRAAAMGTVHLDLKERLAIVKPTSTPLQLAPDDVIIGVITGFRSGMATVRIIKLAGKDRQLVPMIGDGTIHISKVSYDYIEDIQKEFQMQDIVRAKVLKVKPHIQLTTEGEDFGVIKSHCRFCRAPLKRKSHKLYCKECDKTFYRKTAFDYGSGEEVPEESPL